MSEVQQPSPPLNRNAVVIDAATPRLTLGGMEFPIPVLAFKQNRVIEPLLWKVLPVYYKMLELAEKRLADGLAAKVDKTDEEKKAANLAFVEAMQYVDISEESIDLLATVVFTAITRGTPGFSRAEFDMMTFGTDELFEALNTILPQTGIFRKTMNAKASQGDAKMGEAQAGNASTGTS